MISEAQHVAIRAYVLAALNLDLPAGMTALQAAQVAWELQDFPRGGGAWCSLQVVAAVPLGQGPERISSNVGGELEVLHRQEFEVTVSVTLRSPRSDVAPSWATDAGLRLRRVLLARGTSIGDALARAGCSIWRVGGIRELGSLRRTAQYESTAQVDLELRVMAQVVERPGWIETVAGQVTVGAPGAPGSEVVIPFQVPPEE